MNLPDFSDIDLDLHLEPGLTAIVCSFLPQHPDHSYVT